MSLFREQNGLTHMNNIFIKLFVVLIIVPTLAFVGIDAGFWLLNQPSDLADFGGLIVLFITAISCFSILRKVFKQ